MLLVAITSAPIRVDFPGLNTRSFTLPNGSTLTAVTGGILSELREDPSRILAREGMVGPSGGPGTYDLIRVGYDRAEHALLLERLTESGRPLYYHISPDGRSIYAATAHKLLAAAGVTLSDEPSLMPEMMMYRYAMAPRTLFKGVAALQVASTVRATLGADGRWNAQVASRFNPPLADPNVDPETPAKAQAILEDTYRLSGVDPAGCGVLLSGGLDSSILFMIAKRVFGTKESAAAAYVFEKPEDDMEVRYSTTAAQSMGSKHTVLIPNVLDYLHATIDAIHACEQPTVHLQTPLLYLCFKNHFAPRGVRTVMCGEGADGMFGFKIHRIAKYLREHPLRHAFLGFPPVKWGIRSVAAATNRFGLIAELADKKVRDGAPIDDPMHAAWSMAFFGVESLIRARYNCSRRDIVQGRIDALKAYQSRDLLDLYSITAFLSEGSETQLIWSKCAEACGIGLVMPFTTPRLIDLAYRIPWSVKTAEPKQALREVARRLGIEDFIITRPKSGFGVNAPRWGPPGSVMEPLLSLAAGGVPEADLRALQSPETFRAQMLWSLMNYGVWKRLFVQREPVAALHEELDRRIRDSGRLEEFKATRSVNPN